MSFTKNDKPVRLRTKIVIESGSQEDLEHALKTAVGLAKARVMLISFGSEKEGGPTISCRTTTARPKARG